MRQPIEDIRAVCFVGAGTMGCVNSLVAAVSGYQVVLYDVDASVLDRAPARQREFADLMVATGYCDREALDAAWVRIRFTADPAVAARGVDLVSESVVERVDVKRRVHRQFDELCPPSTILTTNTSSLLVSEIEGAVDRGDRFAALHSHLGSPLVDIVPGPRTTAVTVEVLRRYVLSLGGEPLLLRREHPGYVVNSLLGPLLMCAVQLVVRGAADVEAVDRSWMAHAQAPLGPFGMMDLFGLDLVLDNWEHSSTDDTAARRNRRAEAISLIAPLVGAGRHGVKTGRGFYDYPAPAFQRADVPDDADPVVHDRLATAIMMQAVQLAAADVADPDDIDRAWMIGTSLGVGPFGLIERMGTDTFLDRCREQLAAGLTSQEELDAVEAFVRSRRSTSSAEP